MIQKSGNGLFRADKRGHVCAEIMLKHKEEIMIRFHPIGI